MNAVSFESFRLHSLLIKAIKELGFETPTPVQVLAIPELLSGERDAVALAQTGTGKTAAFGIPILQKILTAPYPTDKTSFLVLAPTRELCLQITGELRKFSSYLPEIRIEAVYGGASMENQIRQLRKNPLIVCATPGRLLDLHERREIDLSSLKVVVLDEADEMLNMGFREDIEHILKISAPEKNIWMFSATMPREVQRLSLRFLKNPLRIEAGSINRTAENIAHCYCKVPASEKYKVLKRMLDYYPDCYAIIFCRTKTESQKLSDDLVHDGYRTDALHGDLTQGQREWVMKRFRTKAVQILVATDVAARGIDVDNLTHIIHYHLPDHPEVYTHRSGRTARAGKTGISLALLSPRDQNKWKTIQQVCRFTGKEMHIPSVEQILQQHALFFMKKLLEYVPENNTGGFYPELTNAWSEELKGISKEELFHRFVQMSTSSLCEKYAGEDNVLTVSNASSHNGKTVLRLNLGKWDGLNFSSLKKHLAVWMQLHQDDFFVVSMNNTFSLVELPSRFLDKALSLNRHSPEINGRKVKIEIKNKESFGSGKKKSREMAGRNKKKKNTFPEKKMV